MRYRACIASRRPVEVSGVPESPDLTPEPFWIHWRTSAPWVLLGVILLLAFAVGQPAWVR